MADDDAGQPKPDTARVNGDPTADPKFVATGSDPDEEERVTSDTFDARVEIQKLTNEIAKLQQPRRDIPSSFSEFIFSFPSSGLFFILMGAALLVVAHWRIETTHAAFTFVLVVLGVAVLLYGTGTQAAGNFNSDTTVAKYNIAIAGGAGVLALCTAWGMVTYFREMGYAFQVEKKFVKVLIKSTSDAAKLSGYTTQFTIDGYSIPSALRGSSYVEVYVPILTSEMEAPLKASTPDAKSQQAEAAKKPPRLKRTGCEVTRSKDNILEIADDDDSDDGYRKKQIYGTFYRIHDSNNDPVGNDRRTSKFSQFADVVSEKFDIRISASSFRSLSRGNDFPDYDDTFCVNLLQKEEQAGALQVVTKNLTNSLANADNFNAKGALTAERPNATDPAQLVAR